MTLFTPQGPRPGERQGLLSRSPRYPPSHPPPFLLLWAAPIAPLVRWAYFDLGVTDISTIVDVIEGLARINEQANLLMFRLHESLRPWGKHFGFGLATVPTNNPANTNLVFGINPPGPPFPTSHTSPLTRRRSATRMRTWVWAATTARMTTTSTRWQAETS